MAADRGKGEEAGPEGRDPSAEGEDQLQGAGALAGEDPGAHRRRPQGGERGYGVRRRLGSNAQSTMGADEAIAG
jgi:hypothetical protein